MDDFERELKVGYLDEAMQLLTDAEQCFLNLETAEDDPTIIERLFRLAHNLKGSARAVGFGDIAEFTHQLESLLLKIKKKEMKIHASTVTLLLKCNDHLRMMVDSLKLDLNARIDSHELLAEIEQQLSGKIIEEVPVVAVPEAAAFEAEAVEVEAEPAVPEDESPEIFEQLTSVVQESLKPFETAPAEAQDAPEEPAISVAAAPASTPAAAASVSPAPSPSSNGTVVPMPAGQDESIRVSLRRLERLMNNVGELVILQAVLNQQKYQVESVLVQKTIDQLAKITKDIQDISMSLRMVPLKQTFQKMQRIVRDTSMALNKDVRLELVGEETELDKTVLEQIGDPLVHLVRNAVDHGLESTEERLAAGKSAQGIVRLRAYHQGSNIAIEVRDDGHGLDAKKLTDKAIERGLLKPGTLLTDDQAHQLIFASGFSTKAQITDISGRGVGMDVVKSNVTALQGEIEVETEKGKGTCFRILLPLTLSIIDGMVVRSGEERYVVPIAQVYESVQPTKDDVHFVTGIGEVLSLRGDNLPLYRLGAVLGRKAAQGARTVSESIAIVIRSGKHPFSVLVDDIIGHQQVVIKRLGNEVQHLKGISGGAILGDGRAALILDFNELVSRGAAKTAGSSLTVMKGVA
ncbi:MAG: hypothetical protein A2428_04150 [Bdellovibrionales bacterium RIFOXYC1_FULL_54_43]|nr:MAG: hypothetical protein A2428_04150 [Bdellovibrionales bacterium RIFOXYC1_FULL_54_43]OFZ82942.1 MAG: hypothetical protein A2603_10975 [Bdellovibrionales bacterium RIFOXYD1_FULL_55_31]